MQDATPLRHPATLALLACCLASAAQAQDGYYLRAGAGLDWSEDARWGDADCAQTEPPALFGCGAGSDQRALGAHGDFGRAGVLEFGLGRRLSPTSRVELQLAWRDGLDFSGQANFLGVAGEQPVSAKGESVAAFVTVFADLPRVGVLQPYLGIGLGAARNRVGRVHYAFPGLAAEAATVTRGGGNTDTAWQFVVGSSFALREGLDLDLAWRYADLGEMETAAGGASIVRQSGIRALDVGATRVELKTQGLSLGLRYGL